MDPITLATAATALLAPFIKKAGGVAMDKIAEQLPDTVGKIWNAISNKSAQYQRSGKRPCPEPR